MGEEQQTDKRPWQIIFERTRAQGRANCGHATRSRRVWLRVEIVGGKQKITSVCASCATDLDYTTIATDIVPRRTRVEYLPDKRQIRRLSDA